MAITQNHVINIQPGVSAPLVIHCSQGDTGTQINLTVVNGDEEFDCSSYACSVHGVRSDGGNWGPITCTVSGSTVCFSLTSAMTAVAGACLAEISVGTVGTANFAMLIENATFGNGVTYSNDVSVYQNILNAIQAGLSLAEAAVTNEKNERIAAVTNEKNERIYADNSLSSRMSTIEARQEANVRASTDASADYAAEVVDARVGADGTTYASLGESIRSIMPLVNKGFANLGLITEGHLERDAREEAAYFTIYIPVKLDAGEYVVGVDGTIGDQAVRKFAFMAARNLDGADIVKRIENPIVSGERVIVQLSAEEASQIHYMTMYGLTAEKIDVSISLYGGYVGQIIPNKKAIEDARNDISYLNENGTGIVVAGEFSRAAMETEGRYTKWIPVDLEPGKYAVVVRGSFEEKSTTLRFMAAQNLDAVDTVIGISTDVKEGVLSCANVSEENAERIKYLAFSAVTAEPVDITITLLRGDSNLPRLAALETITESENAKIQALGERVTALEEDEPAKIPDYYFKNNYLPGKIEDIKDDLGFVNGVGFIFFTDPHFNANEKNSKYLIKEIIDKTTLDLVICGGDIVGLIGTEAELYAEAETLVDYQNFIGKDIFFSTRGNHDFYNRDDNNSQNRWLTEGEAYNILGRNSERYTVDMIPEHLCYVIENAAQKTCYLMMNSKDASGTTQSYISGTQAKWIADTLTKYSTWNIVAISHIPSDSNMDSYDPTQAIIQTLLEAFNNKTSVSTTHNGTQITADYSEATGHVICHIVGHSHRDGSTLTNGVLSILTTCDARYRDDGYGATAGTITEQAFDVFCIDYDAKTITAIRVGRGSNRKWSFDGHVIT